MFVIKRPGDGKILAAINRFGIVKVDETSSLEYSDEKGTDFTATNLQMSYKYIWQQVVKYFNGESIFQLNYENFSKFKSMLFYQQLIREIYDLGL